MKIAILGGGPSGLYFAISMKLRDATHDVTIFERNRFDDTFGWGVVLSDETMSNFGGNDPVSEKSIRDNFAYWDDVKTVRGEESMTSGGHGFCGIGRKKLLMVLQDRARELGVNLAFETNLTDEKIAELKANYDLVVAADGLNSRTRAIYEDQFQPEIDMRRNHFVWLGTHQKFDDAFTFIFEETEHGWIWPMPTNSMRIPRHSSSNAALKPIKLSASTSSTSKPALHCARRSLPSIWAVIP